MTEFNFVPAETVERPVKTKPILQEFAQALKDRPGEWCEWPLPTADGYKYNIASRISNDKPNAPNVFRGGGYQATVRHGVLYARYIGGVTSDC